MLGASLHAGDEEVMRARAWRLRERGGGAGGRLPARGPGPRSRRRRATPRSSRRARPTATTRRSNTGSSKASFLEPGPAVVWMRSRVPVVVAGEELTPLQRVLVVADSGNGCQRDARLAPVPVHQRRPDGPSPPAPGRASGSASTRSPRRRPTGSASRTRCSSDERGPIGRALADPARRGAVSRSGYVVRRTGHPCASPMSVPESGA